jgi:hypothetical protein
MSDDICSRRSKYKQEQSHFISFFIPIPYNNSSV